jgi:hypothetical protein
MSIPFHKRLLLSCMLATLICTPITAAKKPLRVVSWSAKSLEKVLHFNNKNHIAVLYSNRNLFSNTGIKSLVSQLFDYNIIPLINQGKLSFALKTKTLKNIKYLGRYNNKSTAWSLTFPVQFIYTTLGKKHSSQKARIDLIVSKNSKRDFLIEEITLKPLETFMMVSS